MKPAAARERARFGGSARRRWAAVALGALFVAAALVALRLAPKTPLAERAPSSTAVYDAEGRLLRLALASDDRYRLWVPLERISPALSEAFLLKEDRHFRWHPGFDPAALARAAFRTATGSGPVQGGSTITMQLARLLYRLNTRSISGKLVQIARAVQLEARYSKDEILEAYLNLTPYGANIEGVAAASLIYFGKRAARLSVLEALTLAVIPQAPLRRGALRETSASLIAARARLFAAWRERHPEDAQYAGLFALPIRLRTAGELPFLAPHASTLLLARQAVAPGRGRENEIRANLDARLQGLIERQVARYIAQARRAGIRNAAAMLVDYRSMAVKAMLGSADFRDAAIEGQVNGALAKRSPGSALKPFIYALAMDQGLIHPLSVLKDAPTSFGTFSPENFDGGFAGPITATDALVRSRNIPAVALAARLSRPGFYDFLKNAGVERMASESHYGLALALGGGEVTMEEIVTLYAMLANRGVLRPLRYRANDPQASGERLISEEASFMTLEMLRENPRPDGIPGARAGVRVAWKTGTSWGFRDAWSVGVLGPYVLAVWVGNFNGEGNPAFVGVQAAAPLFFRIVDALGASRADLAEPSFRMPPNLIRVEVCAASGDLPNAYCPRRATTWFIAGKSPIRVSNVHRPVTVDIRTGRQACPPYDPRGVRVEVYEFWPSDIEKLFAKAGMPRRRPPPLECGREVAAGGAPPAITSPLRGVEYTLRAAHAAEESIPFAANADAEVRTLYWFVNDAFVGESRPAGVLAWKPGRSGTFLVRAVDEQGRADARQLRVVIAQ